MVLLLAMWACAAAGTSKWGPDLTLELPPHLLEEALFGHTKPVETKEQRNVRNFTVSDPLFFFSEK